MSNPEVEKERLYRVHLYHKYTYSGHYDVRVKSPAEAADNAIKALGKCYTVSDIYPLD